MLDNSQLTITDADIKKLRKEFASKKDLENLEKRLEKKFVTKSDFEILVSEIHKMKDEFTIRFDQIMAELKATREEQIVAFYQRNSLKETVNNHESRIGLIENKIAF